MLTDMYMRRIFLLLALCICGAVPALAQRVYWDLGAGMPVPLGSYHEMSGMGPGFSLGSKLLFNVGETPLHIGGALGYLWQDSRRIEDVKITVDGQIERGDLKVSDNAAYLNLVASLRPYFTSSRVRPYLEGFVGTRFMHTYSNVTSSLTAKASASQVRHMDWGVVYGGEAGVLFQLGQGMGLTLGVMYQAGGYMEYGSLWQADIQVVESQVRQRALRSKANLLMPQVSLTFLLGDSMRGIRKAKSEFLEH